MLLMGLLRTLVDPENMLATANVSKYLQMKLCVGFLGYLIICVTFFFFSFLRKRKRQSSWVSSTSIVCMF